MTAEERQLPERKAIKAALRDLGLSNRQVDALLRRGWRALVGETQAELEETRELLDKLTNTLQGVE